MKSRLAVSVLYILIAAMFAPDAIGAFEKLRSWTGKLYDRYSVQVCNSATFGYAAPANALRAGEERSVNANMISSSHEKRLQAIVLKLVGSDPRSGSFEFIRRARRQIHEVLELARLK